LAIDLLLTDIVMPQMSGLELAREVKASHMRIKVLFMSGYTDSTVTGLEMVTLDTPFIQKPFTVTALLDKVREALR
jgi:FixJ family two-component response regulator